MTEIWKPVPYEPFNTKYLISNYGRVKPIKKSKYSRSKDECLKWAWGAKGRYACIAVYCDSKRKQIDIHRTVALAFLEQPDGKNLVRHLDGDTHNNRLDNLAWGDNADNMQDMVKHGTSMRGELNTKAKLTAQDISDIRLRYKSGEISQTALAALYGINQTQISRIVLRQHWSHII